MQATRNNREYDLVVWGATGFTGSLVAEYLLSRYGAAGSLRWAVGGRSREKLEVLLDQSGSGAADVGVVVGDSHDRQSLDALVKRTQVVCSTVGPFAKHGSELVAACARHGTHYCDLTGEVQWIRRMIEGHQAEAASSGARLVHCCGFDSIPSDLGCLFLSDACIEQHGMPCCEIKLRVKNMRGGFSGGTVASMLNVIDEATRDRDIRRVLADPYALNPEGERTGPDGRDQSGPVWDPDVRSWTAPFVMASVNTRVVRRSNAVMGYPYGRDFRYSEAVMTGRGARGWMTAAGISAAIGGFVGAAAIGPARNLLNRFVLPQPGEGPTEEQREGGFFDMLLVGKAANGQHITGRVKGKRDPGYGATSRMLGESAVSLARDSEHLTVGGGFWTPASCMGQRLIGRLKQNAGMSFEITARQ